MDDRVPTEKECHELMEKHSMPENIVRHSIQVMKVSLALADNLKDRSIVDRNLIAAASLLHDIAKVISINNRDFRHDRTGAEMLRGMGFLSIARIVESHVEFRDFIPEGGLEEREIVFYADKRVMHDRIVSIDERIDDLVKRYGITEKIKALITENRELILRIEKKISGYLARDIESLLADLA